MPSGSSSENAVIRQIMRIRVCFFGSLKLMELSLRLLIIRNLGFLRFIVFHLLSANKY